MRLAYLWGLVVLLLSAPVQALPTIRDDPALDRVVAETRAEFLATQSFDRLDVTVLLPQPDGSWRRGSYRPGHLAYPASCVKLAYMAAAVHWCASRGSHPRCLDRDVRPMVVDSDNLATGRVVDRISGVTNYPATRVDPRFVSWLGRRSYTERYLKGRGLLADQRILHKTYPSNSAETPRGAEELARTVRGANAMTPAGSAALLLALVTGNLEPQATGYMRSLLVSERFGLQSALGFGLPPGSLYENKIGVAYDTLEDLAHVVLPNGREFILAAFSNGWDQKQPEPYDGAPLGLFAEMLVERLGLNLGNPPSIRYDDETAIVSAGWEQCRDRQAVGLSYRCATAGEPGRTVRWNLNLPAAGRYEVVVRYPQDSRNGRSVPYTVRHDGGETVVRLDQRVWGGRWVKLGDFWFTAGTGQVTVTTDEARVAVDAVKATRWPGSS